jgi:hypothetical protein
MPTDITLHLALVWFTVGLCTGTGWALGHYLVSKLTTSKP